MNGLATRQLGKTGREVTRVGLGGEGVLRTHGRTPGALAVIQEAVTQGITYYDSARAYAGSEGYYGSFWPEHPNDRIRVFQTSKSANRARIGAEADLGRTLKAMGIQSLDLWQIHDLRTRRDLQAIEGPGGSLEAFLHARNKGLVQSIGVTGHEDPDILTYAVENWPVDTVLLPVNPIEGILGGFLDSTIPAARKRGIGVIGMKILGASYYIFPDAGVTPELLIRYALSQDIDVGIVGCSSPQEVQTLTNAARDFTPLSQSDQDALTEIFSPYVQEMAYYRKK
jgi:aryl-alcohol dehydrogenase-like predicted oxidoreductase